MNSFHTCILVVRQVIEKTVGGKLYLGTKSDLFTSLERLSGPQRVVPTVTNIVLDGADVVEMLKPGDADQVFLTEFSGQFLHVSHLDLVCNSYKADSIKDSHCKTRKKGMQTCC